MNYEVNLLTAYIYLCTCVLRIVSSLVYFVNLYLVVVEFLTFLVFVQTQITFAPTEAVLSSFFPFIMGTSFLPLYTHSYLMFGVNAINRKY